MAIKEQLSVISIECQRFVAYCIKECSSATYKIYISQNTTIFREQSLRV